MKITGFAKTGLAVAAFAALAAAGTGAQAAGLIVPYLGPGFNPNQIQDTNYDRICSAACDGTNSVTSGQFAVGQVIESLLRFDTVNIYDIGDLISDGKLPLGYKLFAYSALTIVSIVENNPSAGGDNDGVCETGEVCLALTSPYVAIYEGTTTGSNWNTLSPDAAIASVTSMTLLTTLGLNGIDDFWFFNFIGGTDPIGDIAALDAADPDQGAYQFGISVVSNPGAIPFTPNGIIGTDGNLHDFIGNGSAKELPTGVNSGWLLQTDTIVSMNVPEPGTLALLGMALLGTGWTRRRQK